MKVALLGLGTTGSHLARQLRPPDVGALQLFDPDDGRVGPVTSALDKRIVASAGLPSPSDPPDVTVLAGPVGTHAEQAERMLAAGSHVVSISDGPDEVDQLLSLDSLALSVDRSLVVGGGFCPGLSELLVGLAAGKLDDVDSISIARAGTAGPACARQHHRALQTSGRDWRDGTWETRRGGSGRDLAWFPDPIGARDCYRGALPSPLLLQPVFPNAHRISARMAANRRDRFTDRLPMLRRPHVDGGPGGIRVEVRGRSAGAVETLVYGVMDHPSVAAATVAAVAAIRAGRGLAPVGAHGLASWPDPAEVLLELYGRGVKVATFSGELRSASPGR
jgi:hypothetical protein